MILFCTESDMNFMNKMEEILFFISAVINYWKMNQVITITAYYNKEKKLWSQMND